MAHAFVFVVGILLLAGCGQRAAITQQAAEETAMFSYDQAEFPGAKPWTSEDFRNDPDNFQSAILGDRGGDSGGARRYSLRRR